ncbi:MAG TPA: hypothetical protein VI728_03250 [Syntrophales bacterium]|nr:hypothetical protein [Syntrophales bacterium]
MPLPKTRDVGKVMHAMKEEDMPHKQKVAIALSTARKAGARIPKKKSRMDMAGDAARKASYS